MVTHLLRRGSGQGVLHGAASGEDVRVVAVSVTLAGYVDASQFGVLGETRRRARPGRHHVLADLSKTNACVHVRWIRCCVCVSGHACEFT